MKKLGLVLTILAVMLVFGLVYIGCDNGSNNYDRTIEELFSKVKADNKAYLRAYISSTELRWYCIDHQRWEMQDGSPVNFNLASAISLEGWYIADSDTVFVASIPKMISILNSFYATKYKTGSAPVNSTTLANGTKLYGWYYFYLNRNGSGGYGGKAGDTEAPCMIDRYLF